MIPNTGTRTEAVKDGLQAVTHEEFYNSMIHNRIVVSILVDSWAPQDPASRFTIVLSAKKT